MFYLEEIFYSVITESSKLTAKGGGSKDTTLMKSQILSNDLDMRYVAYCVDCMQCQYELTEKNEKQMK